MMKNLPLILSLIICSSVHSVYAQSTPVISRDSLLDSKILKISSIHETHNTKMVYGPCCGFIVPKELPRKNQKGLQIDTTINTTDTLSYGFKSIPEAISAIPYCNGGRRWRFLSGRILDNERNPIPFATIKGVNTKRGVIADSSGNYFIGFPGDMQEQLQFSSVGYKTRNFDIAELKMNQDIILVPNDSIYSEVIVKSPGTICTLRHIYCSGYISRCSLLLKPDTVSFFNAEATKAAQLFYIYPNPAVKRSVLRIDINQVSNYRLQLIDNAGKIIHQQEFITTVKKALHQFQLPYTAAAGIHYIVVTDRNSGRQYTQKLIIQ